MGAQAQVGARLDRVEIGHRGRAACAVALGHLIQAHAVLARTVEVIIEGQPGLMAGFDEHPRQRVDVAQVADRQRAIAAMPGIAATAIAFGAFEVGQHIVPVPAIGTACGPAVVVARHATDVAHRIDRAGAAQQLAAWAPQHAPTQLRLRGGGVVPVDRGQPGDFGQPGRHVHKRVPVAAAGFQQQHLDGGVFAEAVGQHAAGRTGTDDDVVVCAVQRSPP